MMAGRFWRGTDDGFGHSGRGLPPAAADRERGLAAIMKSVLTSMAMVLLASSAAWAEGNLAVRAERLPELVIEGGKGFSVTEYEIETGKYYRWRIQSDGRDEYKLLAPELMRNSWIDQVSIEGKEVKPLGGLYAVEFDDEGTIDVYFVPIRPGAYEFYVEGMRAEGMVGTFTVK